MGKQQHIVDTVHRGTKGVGFAAKNPKFENRALRYSIRDAELLKFKILIDGMSEYAAISYIRRMFKEDAIAMGGEIQQYYIINDVYSVVTKAKNSLQKDRADKAKKGVAKKGLSPYTDEELDSFFLSSRQGDDNALKAAMMPSAARFVATPSSPALVAAKKRLVELILYASQTAVFGEAQLLYFVYNGVCKTYVCESPTSIKEAQSVPTPPGIGEAEMLCIYYAFSAISEMDDSLRKEMAIVIHCKDTDVFLPAVINVPRIITDTMTSDEESPALWINLTSAVGNGGGGGGDDDDGGGDDNDDGGDDDGKGKKKGKGFPYAETPFVDVIRVYYEFMTNVNAKSPSTEPWNNIPNPLHVLGLLGILGGSEKVEPLANMSGKGLMDLAIKKPEIISSLFKERAVEVETPFKLPLESYSTPVSERVDRVLRVAVDEFQIADVFTRMVAFKKDTKTGERICRRLDALERRDAESLERIMSEIREAAEQEYARKVREVDEAVKAFNEAKAAGLPTATKTLQTKVRGTSLVFVEISYIMARVRRAVWQLSGEFVNGMVSNGLPLCGEVDAEGLSKWGRLEDGSLTSNIVPFSPTMNLY